MSKKIAIMLDGGHLRSYARKAGHKFDPNYIEKIAHACALKSEDILRVLYYDCAPYSGTATVPISGSKITFEGSDVWLKELAQKDLFAIRRGVLKFRGFVLRKERIPYRPSVPLQDSDFEPKFEQKGVDMRIGLDMAIFSSNRAVDLIALATNDTDCIPAMKHARRAGIQIALVVVPGYKPAAELSAHADYIRTIPWPKAQG